jgi:hypothetical protein
MDLNHLMGLMPPDQRMPKKFDLSLYPNESHYCPDDCIHQAGNSCNQTTFDVMGPDTTH